MPHFDNEPWHERGDLDLPPGQGWQAIINELEKRFPQPIYHLTIRVLASSIELAGEMTDSAALNFLVTAIKNSFRGQKVVSKVVIAAPLHPADHDALDDIMPSMPPKTAGLPQSGMPTPVPFGSKMEAGWQPPPAFTSGSTTDVVTRFPSIRSEGIPEVGNVIELEVDLGIVSDASTSGDPVEIRDFDPNWKFLDVEVTILCVQLDFAENSRHGTVTLFANKTSQPATFKATINELAKTSGHLDITAVFSFNGRASGSAHRSIALDMPEVEDKTKAPVPPDVEQQQGTDKFAGSPPPTFALHRDAEAPVLTVIVKQVEENGTGMCIWAQNTTRAHHSSVRSWVGIIHLNNTAKEFAQSLLENCAVLAPGRHADELRSAGEKIWKKTPAQFRQLYKELLETEGVGFPIQFVVNEAYIPWEMMSPEATSGLPNTDHLYHAHPVGRWPMNGPARPTSFPKGCIASFVPTYKGNSLQYSIEEGQWLKDNLSAVAHEPTWTGFTNLLYDPGPDPIQVVHFAGHGSSVGESGSLGIKMDDDWVSIGQATSSRCRLGSRDQSLFILNACEVGALKAGLGAVEGWPAALTGVGFGGVLAPLWGVKDEHAAELIKDVLGSCRLEAKTVAEALRSARDRRKTKSSTPFAYIFHGDVMATMQK